MTLVPFGFEHTAADMWWRFCSHVVDVENEYTEKDRSAFEVALGEDDEEDEDMTDN